MMTAGRKQLLFVWSMYLLSLECKLPATEEFYPEGNSSTCVTEMRCEMLRKISKACITTAYTYRFINVFICISIGTSRSDSACLLFLTTYFHCLMNVFICIFIGMSRSDSACLLFLTLFIVSVSLHLRW